MDTITITQRPKYLVTDSLCMQTGSADNPSDGIKLIYKQLRESTYIKDGRSLSVLGVDGIYAPIGTYSLRAGCIGWSVPVVKHWRDFEKAAGRDCFLQTYYKMLDICPKCKGNKGELQYVSLEVGHKIGKVCDACRGVGTYSEPKPNKFNLVVREKIYNGSGQGFRVVDMALDSGALKNVLKCYQDIRGAYAADCQFRIENDDGEIVGIQVQGEILWLPNVPPPKYFVKPTPKPPAPEQREICMAGAEGWAHD
jgi:hypothetical protein